MRWRPYCGYRVERLGLRTVLVESGLSASRSERVGSGV